MQGPAHQFGALLKEDIFLIQRWRNQQMDVLRQKRRLTREGQLKWFASLKDDKRQQLFAITLGDSNTRRLIGYCGLTNIDVEHRRAEVSFLVDTRRTKDLTVYREDMTQALNFLARHAFESLGFNKIFTETFAFRRSHMAILEKCGFVRDGALRHHVIIKGKVYDSIMHSLLKKEFSRRRVS